MSETPVPVPFQDPGRVLHLLYESKMPKKLYKETASVQIVNELKILNLEFHQIRLSTGLVTDMALDTLQECSIG